MGTPRRIALAFGAAALVASTLTGVGAASAQSYGDVNKAFTDYTNGISTGTMTDRGVNRRWVFTYGFGDGTSFVETYDVNRYTNYAVYVSGVWFGDTQRRSRPSTSDK